MAAPPSNGHDSDYSDSEFSPSERKRLRRLMDEHKYMHRFWTTIRTWLMWIGGVAVALTATYTWIKDAVKALVR